MPESAAASTSAWSKLPTLPPSTLAALSSSCRAPRSTSSPTSSAVPVASVAPVSTSSFRRAPSRERSRRALLPWSQRRRTIRGTPYLTTPVTGLQRQRVAGGPEARRDLGADPARSGPLARRLGAEEFLDLRAVEV